MTQLDYTPGPPGRSPDSREAPLDYQRRATDTSLEATREKKRTAPSNSTQENVAEPHTQTDLDKENGKKGSTETNVETGPSSQRRVLDALGDLSTTFAPPRIVQTGLEIKKLSEQPLDDQPNSTDTTDGRPANIVIFGETGVGKSSIINLIANKKRAYASNDALGCTFQYKRHIVELGGIQCALWDTTGLDEGSKGMIPAEFAEANLKDLIEKLIRSGGIHLVIYCIRATRLTTALKRNYDLFYVTVCQKKVPVALVVTGLEYHEGNMETWWKENEAVLQRCGMKFDEHACVTTLEIDDPDVQTRRLDSQERLQNLVAEYALRRPWKIDHSWSSTLLNVKSLSLTNKRTVRRVIVYDRTTFHRTRVRKMGDLQQEFEWVYVNTPDANTAPPGVLVFYTSLLSGNDISAKDNTALMTFYKVVGREVCPVIIVVRRRDNTITHRSCCDAILSRRKGMSIHCATDSPEELDATVESLCKEREEVRWISWTELWKSFLDTVSGFYF